MLNLGEFVENKTHRFQCFSANVIIKKIYNEHVNTTGNLETVHLPYNRSGMTIVCTDSGRQDLRSLPHFFYPAQLAVAVTLDLIPLMTFH